MNFNLDVLKIDPVQVLDKLSEFIVDQMNIVYRKKGVVVGLSGGIDSACIGLDGVRTECHGGRGSCYGRAGHFRGQ